MRWKIALVIFVLGVVILVSAGYVYLRTRDYNLYKGLIEQTVRDRTGRQFVIGGRIDLTFSLVPELMMTDVKLENASWGSQPQMLKIARVQASVKLLPLLLGNVQVRGFTLKGTDLLFETDAAGRSNWEFSSTAAPTKGIWPLRRLGLQQLRVDNLSFHYRDGKTGKARHTAVTSFKAARARTVNALLLDVQATLDGQPVALSGQIGLAEDMLAGKHFPIDLSGTVANTTIMADGAIGDLLGLEGIDVDLQAKGHDLSKLGAAIRTKLPRTDTIDVAGHLSGSAKALVLDHVKGIFTRGGVEFAVDGDVGNLVDLSQINLQLKASGANLAEFSPIIGETLPETGPVTVTGRLTGSKERPAFEDARMSITRGGLKVFLDGDIAELSTGSGVDVVLNSSGTSLAEVGQIMGSALPDTGPFKLTGRLKGSLDELALESAKASVSRDGLMLTATGTVRDLNTLDGIDLGIRASGKDLAEVGPLFDTTLPNTGPFSVRGRLTGSARALALQDVQGSTTRDSLRLLLNGNINDLSKLEGMQLKLKGSGKNLAEIEPLIRTPLPETGPFTVTGSLTGSAKALSLQNAQLAVSRDNASLEVNGQVGDLLKLTGIDLKIKGTGQELAELGPLIGKELPELGPFNVAGELSGFAKVLVLNNISLIVDRSDFAGRARLEFQNRPKITVELESALLDLTPFMKKLDEEEQELKETDEGYRRLFSQKPLPFDALEAVDADIVLKAKLIHSRDARLKLGHMTLALENRELNVDLQATYKEMKISGGLHVFSGSPPRTSTKFLVQNFDLGGFLREHHLTDKVESHIDVAANLISHGTSPSGLMTNLNGSVGAVMGQGYLTTRYLDMLASDVSKKVIPFWGKHDDTGRIECAMVQFDIKDGLAASQAFYFNTQPVVLIGQGDINLATETVDFFLEPKPKDPSLFSLAMELEVSGSVTNPKVRPSTGALLKKGGKLLTTLAVGPAGLLAPFVSLGARNKHPCDIEAMDSEIKSLAK